MPGDIQNIFREFPNSFQCLGLNTRGLINCRLCISWNKGRSAVNTAWS